MEKYVPPTLDAAAWEKHFISMAEGSMDYVPENGFYTLKRQAVHEPAEVKPETLYNPELTGPTLELTTPVATNISQAQKDIVDEQKEQGYSTEPNQLTKTVREPPAKRKRAIKIDNSQNKRDFLD